MVLWDFSLACSAETVGRRKYPALNLQPGEQNGGSDIFKTIKENDVKFVTPAFPHPRQRAARFRPIFAYDITFDGI